MYIDKNNIEKNFESNFLNVYDLQYAPGRHYYDATRRKFDDIMAIKSDEEYKKSLPDAVSCIVIVDTPQGRRLLLSYEYRYPTGHFLLGVPAGLIDREDIQEFKNNNDAVIKRTAIREIKEETGLEVKEEEITLINSFLFSTPGMTDESNALVCVNTKVNDLSVFNTDNAESTELFDGFRFLSKEEAEKILKDGRDDRGNFYSMFTWAALVWFCNH